MNFEDYKRLRSEILNEYKKFIEDAESRNPRIKELDLNSEIASTELEKKFIKSAREMSKEMLKNDELLKQDFNGNPEVNINKLRAKAKRIEVLAKQI